MRRALITLIAASSAALLAVSTPAMAMPAPHPRLQGHPGLSLRLQRLVRAFGSDEALYAQRVSDWRVEEREGRIRVQIHPAQGQPLDTLGNELFAAFGGRVEVRGVDVLDAWVPLESLGTMADATDLVGLIRLPQRPVPTTGSVVPGSLVTMAVDAYHCAGVTGDGVIVAVADANLGGFESAVAAGEIPELDELPVGLDGGHHGTACAEIVADVAPGASIVPVDVDTLAQLQYFVQTLPFEDVDLVSQSEMYVGLSFGDSAGPVCKAVSDAQEEGVAWVSSEGNILPGHFWSGEVTDEDGDGWLEFPGGGPYLGLDQDQTASLSITLDWDDYALSFQDYDLYLYRWQAGDWELLDTSENIQGGLTGPVEEISLGAAYANDYAISVYARANAVPGTRMRVLVLGMNAGVLETTGGGGSIYDPASCAGTVSVGALAPSLYEVGPPEAYSGHGPTTDGRIAPTVMAPSRASTSSMGMFIGSSAAAPHVAGALALLMEATGQDPAGAVQQLIADAIPMGQGLPNNTYGYGRVELNPAWTTWECAVGEPGTCETTCGSEGSTMCSPGCTWASCEAPDEACTGTDLDCDGSSDEGFPCALGNQDPCETACGSTGARTCGEGCQWGACDVVAEACSGEDEDCDGQADEGFPCVLGAVTTCATTCASVGSQLCEAECLLGACTPPVESCNGHDDDCDDRVDEGLSCGQDEGCSVGAARPGGPGSGWLWWALAAVGLARLGHRRPRLVAPRQRR